MGTPVPSKIREQEYSENLKRPELIERQLTEDERRYYDSLGKPKNKAVYIFPEDEDLYITKKENDEEMAKRIEAPSREELATMCRKHPTRYRATVAIAESMSCSRCTVDRWILDYGLKGIWDKPVMAIQELPIQVKDEEPVKYEYLKDSNDSNELTLGVQPGNGQIHYAEDDEFMLKSEVYKSGTFEIEVRHDVKMVIVCDIENCDELCLPFERIGTFACKLQSISNLLKERQEM